MLEQLHDMYLGIITIQNLKEESWKNMIQLLIYEGCSRTQSFNSTAEKNLLYPTFREALLGVGGGVFIIVPVWISNLSRSQFQKVHRSLSEFRPVACRFSSFQLLHVAVSELCRLSELTLTGLLQMHQLQESQQPGKRNTENLIRFIALLRWNWPAPSLQTVLAHAIYVTCIAPNICMEYLSNIPQVSY